MPNPIEDSPGSRAGLHMERASVLITAIEAMFRSLPQAAPLICCARLGAFGMHEHFLAASYLLLYIE